MARHFIYCEDCDGGMSAVTFDADKEIPHLCYCWMEGDCVEVDKELIEWMRTAEVGSLYEHRLGYCIRLKESYE